jgi:hypothetical protein
VAPTTRRVAIAAVPFTIWQPATPTLAVLDLGMVSLSDLVLEAARKMDLAFWMVVAASILLGAVGAWLCDT